MLTKLERQQELEEGLGNALARVEDLEKIEEMHRKMNGELRQEVYDWKTKANQNVVLQNKIDVQKQIIEELSMFAITDRGKFEGVGAHDDLVMGLALANAATQHSHDTFVLIDDLEFFDAEPIPNDPLTSGILGLNL